MQIIRNVNVCITNFVWRKDDRGMQYLKLFLADLLGSWHFHIKSFKKFFSRCYKMAIWIRKVFMSCFFYVTLKKYRGLFWLPLKIVTNDGTKRKSNISSDLLSVPSSLSSSPYLQGTSAYRGTSPPKHSLKLQCKQVQYRLIHLF